MVSMVTMVGAIPATTAVTTLAGRHKEAARQNAHACEDK